ncbi:MAG: succinate--CoA ligase subunit alpha [bacterium]|jgi:succinyl-CoA synthetase alpha subunit
MSILLTPNTRAVIQGITGRIGSVQAKWMLEAGTNIVAGVTPGRGGQEVLGVPVYDTVWETVEKHGANATVIFAPAPFTKNAVLEAIAAGVKLVVAVPEHVPVADAMEMREKAKAAGVILLGPTTPGIISPGIGKLGIMPANMFKRGRIGVISRSGTLSYEAAGYLNDAGLGESTVLGIGGDPVIGADIADYLQAFEADAETDAVVLVGEIGGAAEEAAAPFIKSMTKPVVAYIAGRSAPPGRRMGHAGAIIQRGVGTVASKTEALTGAGAMVAKSLAEVPQLLRKML